MRLKQERFCREYLLDFNATQAAIRAGYSKRSAKVIASRMLTGAHVQAEIARLVGERNERLEIDADWVLKQLAKLAQVDLLDLFEGDGSIRDLDQMTPEARRLIAGLEIMETKLGKQTKLRLVDRLRVLGLIGKHVACQYRQ